MGLIRLCRKTVLLYLIVSFVIISIIGYCFMYGLPGFKENGVSLTSRSSIAYDRLLDAANTSRETYKLVHKGGKDVTRLLDLYVAKFKMFTVSQNVPNVRERRKFVQNEFKRFQAVNVVTKQFGITQLDSVDSQKQFIVCPAYELWKHNRSSQIPPHFQECHKMSFRSSGPVTLLTSYPGSGNSWVRQLIETATGIYTGSVFCDPSYVAFSMIGEGLRTGNVIVVKTHFSKIESSKVIYLIRNPFDAIVAEWSRFVARRNMAGRHVSEVGKEHFGSNAEWDRSLRRYIVKWLNHVKDWLELNDQSTLVIQYEKLQTNLDRELRRVLDFLKYPYTEDDIQCTLQSGMSNFHRNHTKHFDPYTPSQKQFILQKLQIVRKTLHQNDIDYLP